MENEWKSKTFISQTVDIEINCISVNIKIAATVN
jgi:hypothetical protein